MSASVTIRPAGPSDLEALCALVEELFSLEEDFSFDPGQVRSGISAMLDNPSGRLLAAEAEGRVVGMCSGQLTVSTAEGGSAVLVEDVVVAEDFRGLGVGRMLMDELNRWARDNRAGRLQLLADMNNGPALAFYERLGWSPTNLICLRRILPQGV